MRQFKKNEDGLFPAQWLKALLSSGPRLANEVTEAGLIQGFSERTLNRWKKDAGVKSQKRGGIWYWLKESDTLPSAKPSKPEPVNVDAFGYSTLTPTTSNGSVNQMGILYKIRDLKKAGLSDQEIVNEVLAYGYPNAGMSESMIIMTLKANNVIITHKDSVTRIAEIQ